MTNHTSPVSLGQPTDFVVLTLEDKHTDTNRFNQSLASDSCSSISFMDSCSTLDASFCSLAAAIATHYSKSKTLKPCHSVDSMSSISHNSPSSKRNNFAKRKKAILRRSNSFDDSFPNMSFLQRPRPKKSRPRRHRSTGSTDLFNHDDDDSDDDDETLHMAEEIVNLAARNSRWQSQSPTGDQAPKINTSNHSTSRWDSGAESDHSKQPSLCCRPPSRHDSFSEIENSFALYEDSGDGAGDRLLY